MSVWGHGLMVLVGSLMVSRMKLGTLRLRRCMVKHHLGFALDIATCLSICL